MCARASLYPQESGPHISIRVTASPNLHTFAEMITPQRAGNRFDSARYCHSHKRSPLRLSLIGVFRRIVYKRGRIVLELVYPAIVKRSHRSHRSHRLHRSHRSHRSHRPPVLFFLNVFCQSLRLALSSKTTLRLAITVCFYQQISVLLYRVTRWVPEFFTPKF